LEMSSKRCVKRSVGEVEEDGVERKIEARL
jgi:hypothetical protein